MDNQDNKSIETLTIEEMLKIYLFNPLYADGVKWDNFTIKDFAIDGAECEVKYIADKEDDGLPTVETVTVNLWYVVARMAIFSPYL